MEKALSEKWKESQVPVVFQKPNEGSWNWV